MNVKFVLLLLFVINSLQSIGQNAEQLSKELAANQKKVSKLQDKN